MAEIKDLLIELDVLKYNNNLLKNEVARLKNTIKQLQEENEKLLSQDTSLKF